MKKALTLAVLSAGFVAGPHKGFAPLAVSGPTLETIKDLDEHPPAPPRVLLSRPWWFRLHLRSRPFPIPIYLRKASRQSLCPGTSYRVHLDLGH